MFRLKSDTHDAVLGVSSSTRKEPTVGPRQLILDFSEFDLSNVVADLAEIRRYNPQRFEMEQITAIVFHDPQRGICVGYKDCQATEFWVRGHMPGRPILPGVVMCEAAAQCSTYFAGRHDLAGTKMIGFAGMDEIRFREPVFVGDRLTIVVELLRVRRGAMMVFRFQEFVDQRLVCEGTIKGVALPDELEAPT